MERLDVFLYVSNMRANLAIKAYNLLGAPAKLPEAVHSR